MPESLTPDEPSDHVNMVKLECPAHWVIINRLKSNEIPSKHGQLSHECPQCSGYGGRNIIVNNDRPRKYLKIVCDNCYGWGYVDEQAKDHIHLWKRIACAPEFTSSRYCTTCMCVYDTELFYRRLDWKFD